MLFDHGNMTDDNKPFVWMKSLCCCSKKREVEIWRTLFACTWSLSLFFDASSASLALVRKLWRHFFSQQSTLIRYKFKYSLKLITILEGATGNRAWVHFRRKQTISNSVCTKSTQSVKLAKYRFPAEPLDLRGRRAYNSRMLGAYR